MLWRGAGGVRGHVAEDWAVFRCNGNIMVWCDAPIAGGSQSQFNPESLCNPGAIGQRTALPAGLVLYMAPGLFTNCGGIAIRLRIAVGLVGLGHDFATFVWCFGRVLMVGTCSVAMNASRFVRRCRM